MKLTGNSELGVVVVLIGLIAFMPKLLSVLVSSQIGKALAFAFVAYLWKQHNELIALLLAVALIRACPSYEGVDETLSKEKKEKKSEDTSPPGSTTATGPS